MVVGKEHNNISTQETGMVLFTNTNALTGFRFKNQGGGTFRAGSMVQLYGLKVIKENNMTKQLKITPENPEGI